MKIAFEIEANNLRSHLYAGAVSVWNDITQQGREAEAFALLEELEDILGHVPALIDVNDFIWFDLPDMMDLYNEGTEEED